MNAVVTAEYVVIVRDNVADVEEEINTQAKQGYRLVSFETNPESKWEEASYSAVMVREPQPTYLTDWQARMAEWEEAFKKSTLDNSLEQRVADLESRLQALDANYENTRQQVISHEAVRPW